MQHSGSLAISWGGIRVRERPRAAVLALGATLLLALLLRVAAFYSQTYVIYPDETFQYFEQAHRLVFGSGVIPWEYFEGIRSWVLPGLLAAIMEIATRFSDSPLAYVQAARLCCAAASLSVVWISYRLALQIGGVWAAVLASGFCAIWFELVWFAPTVVADTLSAHCALMALWCGQQGGRRRLFWSGVGLGLAACLRFQYAPALLAASLWQYRLDRRQWGPVLAGGAVAVLPVAGLLDWVTLGTPFQSIWLNFVLNSVHGVASSMGTATIWYYPEYIAAAFNPAALLIPLAAIGARRAPALAIAAIVTLGTHSLVPHKEMRFIYLTIAVLPILIGIGSVEVVRFLASSQRASVLWPVVAFILIGAGLLSWHNASKGVLAVRWQYHRATVEALLTARAAPALCGIAIRDDLAIGTSGYTYLHRDVPLFLAYLPAVQHLRGSDLGMRSAVILHDRPVPQVPPAELGRISRAFNYLLAPSDQAAPGYTRLQCFDDMSRGLDGHPPLCLFMRPGGCASP